MEKWGTDEEKRKFEYDDKKRDALHKEITTRNNDLKKQDKKRQQREILCAWRDAKQYIQENRKEIIFGNKPVIDLERGSRNQKNPKEAPKKKHDKPTIKEYTDWNHGKTFTEKPIQIERDKYRITQIRKYIQTERKRRIAVRTKQGLNGRITHTLGKWRSRQLEATLRKLQEAANNSDMQPIWKYQRNIRMKTTNNQAIIKEKWRRMSGNAENARKMGRMGERML